MLSFLARLLAVFSLGGCLSTENGCGIDPNGLTGDNGCRIDPNGGCW